MREVKAFTLRETAPIFCDAAHCASNVVKSVGIGQEHEDLIRAVLRNYVAAPQRFMHTLKKLFDCMFNGNGFIIARPFEREQNNTNRLAVTCAGALEETINIAETFKGQNVRARLLVAFGENHFKRQFQRYLRGRLR